jgi:broad specificity phosphatase PhoE
MSTHLPTVYLSCHGETAWSLTGHYTPLIDLPITGRREHPARQLGGRLKGLAFANAS